MILEIQKQNNQYIIKNPPDFDSDNYFIKIEKKNILKIKPVRRTKPKTDIAFQQLKELAEKFSDDNFINNMLKYYKPHNEKKHRSDEEVYHDYLMERYGK